MAALFGIICEADGLVVVQAIQFDANCAIAIAIVYVG